MRGKVITYSDVEGQGLISGDDGRRYAFVRGALGAGLRVVQPGQDVDFQINGDQAEAIYVIGQSGGQIGGRRLVAGLLAICLGGLGIHKYTLVLKELAITCS
jgi:cold shock CspA family protein